VNKLLYAGIDWATKAHAVGVVDDQGGIRARFQVPNTGKGFGGLIRRLTKLGVAAVAIERPDGPLVQAMLDAGLRVVVITPGRSRRCAAAMGRLAPSPMLPMRCWPMCCAPTATACGR
jgi:Transposase